MTSPAPAVTEEEVGAVVLLPCPFCGSDKVASSAVTLSLCEVSCSECEASIPSWENNPTWEAGLRDAEAKWNRRATSSGGDADVLAREEDDRFAREFREAQRIAGAHGNIEPYARALSGRLRQMDKRAKAANRALADLREQTKLDVRLAKAQADDATARAAAAEAERTKARRLAAVAFTAVCEARGYEARCGDPLGLAYHLIAAGRALSDIIVPDIAAALATGDPRAD